MLALLCLGTSACGKQEKLKADTPVEKEFSEVSVHDPSIVQGDDGSYYIFGSYTYKKRLRKQWKTMYLGRFLYVYDAKRR